MWSGVLVVTVSYDSHKFEICFHLCSVEHRLLSMVIIPLILILVLPFCFLPEGLTVGVISFYDAHYDKESLVYFSRFWKLLGP